MKLVSAEQFTLETLTHVYNESRVDYIVPMPMSVGRMQEYIDLYDVDLDASWVAVDGDEPVGLGMLGVRSDRAWITRIGVLPNGRRHGVGRALTKALIQSAAKRELPVVWLEVIVGNRAAHQLFLVHGFEPTRELIVARRPPTLKGMVGDGDTLDPLTTRRVKPFGREGALRLLRQRSERANWLLETESLANVGNLSALQVDFVDGSRGWVAFHLDRLMLSHIYVGVKRGEVTDVTVQLLSVLHGRYPTKDAITENLPAESNLWAGFQKAGYFDAFRRTEMVLHLPVTD
ncbi:MAG: GNAT family N-acetyltransferase [Candidatus Promineifilaceae bacterium]|nr:GNAT family N-acetyltransferase [Candidatus Promineifilaceae bacterium]